MAYWLIKVNQHDESDPSMTVTPEQRQDAWWRTQAQDVLQQLGMSTATFNWHAYTHNAVFTVDDDNTSYILRLSQPPKAAHIAIEATILKQLAAAQLAVPDPVATGATATVAFLLMSRLTGIPCSLSHLTTDHLLKIGHFLAQFHNTPLHIPQLKRELNWEGLFSETGIYQLSQQQQAVLSKQQRAVMDQVSQQVKSAMATLDQYEKRYGIIHGDFLLNNILFDGHDNNIQAIDFEYCSRGYYLYDLTPILWQLKPTDTYAAYREALLHSYCQVRPLKSTEISLLETFIAGRQVASMRWIAANQQNPHVIGRVGTILQQRTRELEGFLTTGQLQRQA